MSRRTVLTRPRALLEFDYYIAPDGAQYAFGGTGAKWVLADTGHGMPPIEYFQTIGPLQHGATLQDFRLRPRTIRLLIRQEACDRAEWWALRAALMNAIRPNRQTGASFALGVLRKVYNNGTRRDIACMVQEGPAFNLRSLDQWQEWSIGETIDFICPDAVFYDPDSDDITFSLAASTELQFPITFSPTAIPASLVFGGSTLLSTVNVTYVGTWLSYPTLTLVGPFNTPTIENAATSESIGLDYNIPAGRTVTITLAYGEKNIVDDLGTNLLGTLTTDSDFATFHIAPDPEAAGGVNPMTFSAAGVVPGVSSATLAWLTRYIGF